MNRISPRPIRISARGAAAGCALAAVLAAAACAGPSAPAPAPSVVASASAAPFGGTDLAWIEINIAMNEELQPLLALAADRAADPALRTLVTEVTATNEAELAALRALHDEARLPAENPHKGMPMPGMVTPEMVTEASRAGGAAFDTLVAGRITDHLEQGVNLAGSERKAGVEPRTKQLAEKAITARDAFLPRLAEIA